VQYNELGGIQDKEVPGGSGSAEYTKALAVLDADMPQYIHDNTDDELSHFQFINAYLASKGADTVNLDQFRTLPSSKATGAKRGSRRPSTQVCPSEFMNPASLVVNLHPRARSRIP